jgi:DNA-binding NarL/FixJ family response regulator
MASEFKNDEERGNDFLDPSSKELRGIHRTLRAEPLRVVLADEDRLFVEGVASLLSGWEEFKLVGRAYTLEDALMLTLRLEPSVVMMGATMHGVPCADVVRKICDDNPNTRVMILASMGESGFVLDALRAGARGFGSRDELTSDRLRSLVWALACGDIAFSGSLGTQLQGALMGKDGKVSGYLESEAYIAALDDRERTILALLEEGLSNAEISNRLYLSEPTVKKAIGSILRKLHVNNLVQAAVMYAKYSQ